MRSFEFENSCEGRNPEIDYTDENLAGSEDLIMEQILGNINATPIGKVLKKIASLPEVRQQKVLDVRRKLTDGQYELSERLDIALEKVLEDITT